MTSPLTLANPHLGNTAEIERGGMWALSSCDRLVTVRGGTLIDRRCMAECQRSREPSVGGDVDDHSLFSRFLSLPVCLCPSQMIHNSMGCPPLRLLYASFCASHRPSITSPVSLGHQCPTLRSFQFRLNQGENGNLTGLCYLHYLYILVRPSCRHERRRAHAGAHTLTYTHTHTHSLREYFTEGRPPSALYRPTATDFYPRRSIYILSLSLSLSHSEQV